MLWRFIAAREISWNAADCDHLVFAFGPCRFTGRPRALCRSEVVSRRCASQCTSRSIYATGALAH